MKQAEQVRKVLREFYGTAKQGCAEKILEVLDPETPSKDLLGVPEPKGSHLFRNSPYYTFAIFEKALKDAKEVGVDIHYYYNAVLNWSESKGAKRQRWLSVARTFMQRDKSNGKLMMIKEEGSLKHLNDFLS